MSRAPANVHLRKAIRELVDANFALGAERVFFLGLDGELREVLYPSDGRSALRTKRADLLSRGQLGAVVHLSLAKWDRYAHLSMVETYDTGKPEVHTMVTWPAQGVWVKPQPDAAERWRDVWGEEGAIEE